MDFLSKSIEYGQRKFNIVPPVSMTGYVPHKRTPVKMTFSSVNFSFILSGSGYYYLNGERHDVVAPCVIMQWPGAPMEYGPWREWEEFYLIYSGEQAQRLHETGVWRETRFKWMIQNSARVERLAGELYEMLESFDGSGNADRIDMLCFDLIVESLLERPQPPLSSKEKIVHHLAGQIRHAPEKNYDFAELAASNRLSLSSLRRHWIETFQEPPGHFLNRMRITKACRMLVETRNPVGDIAPACGFDDPLYFSRRFRKMTGQTPTDYRNSRRIPY